VIKQIEIPGRRIRLPPCVVSKNVFAQIRDVIRSGTRVYYPRRKLNRHFAILETGLVFILSLFDIIVNVLSNIVYVYTIDLITILACYTLNSARTRPLYVSI